MTNPSHIMITGASGGLGAALARVYAAPHVTLGLLGRDSVRLDATAQLARAMGATVVTGVIDITDAKAMEDWIRAFDRDHPVDLLVANAGLSGGTAGGDEPYAQAKAIFAVNLDGVLNSVHPVLESMKKRRRGQIAIISSIAGFRGVASAPAYTASKAAVRYYGQALRALLAPYGVGVTVVCPGFIRTRMTDVNDFPMPFILDAESAAWHIRRGLGRNPALLVFPWIMGAMARLQNFLPDALINKLYSRLPAKPASETK
jgi:short-subunit dehydrogenase